MNQFMLVVSSIELFPSLEAASCADAQYFSSIVWQPNVQYYIRKSTSLIFILSQINPYKH
jgi:hypothetical protein